MTMSVVPSPQYPSGGPQDEDVVIRTQAWDIGGAGVVPNIIGGSNDIYAIGINNDGSVAMKWSRRQTRW
eukprot:CAMPEP_0194044284 /NCGR_PEP_ID=MMETSP0009_2-20130614/15780_1 /TAXON_ID=210454 /ORGANISM="Grammatophora oceanica, Strain CCMP 410" /LENGTH=68 /DNA_ID=CAMNT_0038688763 /DNA_START=167 /DNA_END=369 /DNA_ORIENTATION=-